MREDWIECKLEDLLDYEQPTKYIIQEEKYNDEFPTPVLTAGKSFIKGYTNEDFGIFDNLPTIIFDDFTTASQFVNFKFKVKSSAMKILVPTSKLVNLKFAFGAMQVNKVRSETHKRYWISEYSKLTIGLPPLVEQRTIVKKLESLFSSLDAGVADLKKAQQQLKIYRQAVLKKAFEGALTTEWRTKQSNLPSNDELLKLINDERENYYQIQLEEWQMAISDWEKNGDSERKPVKPKLSKLLNPITKDEFVDDLFDIPTNWIWDRLENLIFEVKDGTHDTPKYQEKGIPFITQKNIKNNDITFDNIQFISNLDHQKFFARSNVKRNDIIMAMIGHNRGTCTIVKTDVVFSIKNVALFKFFEQVQLNKYFLYFFQFIGGLEIILKKSKGGAQPFIGLTELRNWPIPYCSLLEQLQIVKEIESRLSVCDSIEENIKESLEKAEALRQSILKKAFEGNLLTAQELAECKQAADYEPASVLLKKIKSEHEANKLVDRTIKIKPKIKMDKKEILVLLMENNSEMPVDQLWKDSVYTNDIDAFYLKLKELSEQGKIEEVKNGKKVTIKLI